MCRVAKHRLARHKAADSLQREVLQNLDANCCPVHGADNGTDILGYHDLHRLRTHPHLLPKRIENLEQAGDQALNALVEPLGIGWVRASQRPGIRHALKASELTFALTNDEAVIEWLRLAEPTVGAVARSARRSEQ